MPSFPDECQCLLFHLADSMRRHASAHAAHPVRDSSIKTGRIPILRLSSMLACRCAFPMCRTRNDFPRGNVVVVQLQEVLQAIHGDRVVQSDFHMPDGSIRSTFPESLFLSFVHLRILPLQATSVLSRWLIRVH